MSTAKRSRQRQPEASSASLLPASKRQKVNTTSHVPTKNGLGFLVDEDARAGKKLEARLTNGVRSSKASRVDESRALVAADTKEESGKVNGKVHDWVVDISSGVEESSAYEESEDEAVKQPIANGHVSKKINEDVQLGAEDDRMEDVQAENGRREEDAVEEEPAELSFGDLLRARHPDPVDVHASLPKTGEERTAVVPSGSRALTTPTGLSLGIVLTQALKTNDKDMLENCFQATDLPTIRSTIERLQSQHAAVLLQRLTERIHRSPGRTGNLMIWIQWTLVTHGGYIASQPETMKKLKSLAQVLRERASGLQPLLHLKGKLDLLSAQLDHRRNLHASSRGLNADEEDDEEAVVYVEGQDDDDWSDNDVDMQDHAAAVKMLPAALSKTKGQTATPRTDDSDSGEDNEEGLPNGVVQEEDDDDDDDDEEEEEGLFDEEAEETSDDENEEASSDDDADSAPESEDESEASEEESETEIKAPPPKTLNRKR